MTATFEAGLKDYDAGDYKAAYDKWHTIEDYDLAAARNIAVMLRKGQGVPKDSKAALKKMADAGEAGLATAQFDTGDMLLKGEGVAAPDPAGAAPWLARAAAAGHPLAAYELAQLYETGTGVKKDIETARKLYQLAAKGGVLEAQERLKTLPPPPQAPPPH
jgi:TPR repeat protein